MIDVQRDKEKGYETVVKEGLCDEVRTCVALISYTMVYNGSVRL